MADWPSGSHGQGRNSLTQGWTWCGILDQLQRALCGERFTEQFVVEFMARTDTSIFSTYGHTRQGKITNGVKYFMAHKFVGKRRPPSLTTP
jgi:hypothetical protein